jgi:hypothetical protein
MSDRAAKRKREKFLPEEDVKLVSLVGSYGTTSWETIAALMPGRNPRQCRERWKHHLSGDAVKVPWSYDDDRLLFEKMQTMGPKWTSLATLFPGRTDIEIKTHWMQTFAHCSNFHVQNRAKKNSVFTPTHEAAAPIVSHVQFAPIAVAAPPAAPAWPPARMPPRDPTPQARFEWFSSSCDPSFGSMRSFYDFGELD